MRMQAAAEENSEAGAGKVNVDGFGRMKVTMTILSAGKDYPLGSCKAGISYTFQDCACSGDIMVKVKGCFSSLTLRVCQTHLSDD